VSAAVGIVAPTTALAESVGISVGSNPTQDVPLSVAATGVAETNARLYLLVQPSAEDACASTPALDLGRWLSGSLGDALGAGRFSDNYTFTPTEATQYRLCAYLDETPNDTPGAVYAPSFPVVVPWATLSLSPNTAASDNQPVTVTATGATEVDRTLYILVQPPGSNTCGSAPEADHGTLLSSTLGEPLSAGSYSDSLTFLPTETRSYTLCGYVDESPSGYPNAVSSASFTNVTPQTRAEERQHAAAEAKAREAARLAAEQAHYDAEVAAAKARAHSTPVSHLSVTPVAHSGGSLGKPGYTSLDVATSPFAYVVVELSRFGHTDLRSGEWGNQSSEIAEVIHWSCKKPGGTYHYVVTAWSGVGHALTRRGQFHAVSGKRCLELRRAERTSSKRRRPVAP